MKEKELSLFGIMIAAHGFNIEQAAKHLSVTRGYVSLMVHGKVPEESLKKYVQALGYSENDYNLMKDRKESLDKRKDLDYSEKYQRLLLIAVAFYIIDEDYTKPTKQTKKEAITR